MERGRRAVEPNDLAELRIVNELPFCTVVLRTVYKWLYCLFVQFKSESASVPAGPDPDKDTHFSAFEYIPPSAWSLELAITPLGRRAPLF